MNCNEIISVLEEHFPPACAEEWDNPGLLAGRREREVRKVMVALDAADEVVEQAVSWKADLLVTHHPLIFGGLKNVSSDTFTGRRLISLIENRISLYAMHTNYDICGMADLNASMLGLQNCEVLSVTGEGIGLGKVGDLPEPVTYYSFAERIKKIFGLSDVRCYGSGNPEIRRAAVCGGSGKSLLNDAIASGADVFVTGDIDYHTGIDAWAKGIRMIDAGHYGTEHCFVEDVTAFLSEKFPELEILAAAQEVPYKLI